MSVADLLIDVLCPRCRVGPRLPETTLADIVQCLQETAPDAVLLTLVCPKCKDAFQFDYRRRSNSALGLMPRTDQIQKLFHYAWFSILAECGRDNCGSPTLLFAIRPSTTTDKEFAKELSTWNLFCEF